MANTFSNIFTPPKNSASPFTAATIRPTNPFSSALNNVASGVKTQVPPTPQPATPLKSTTINNTDGSSVTHTYHSPTTNSNKSTGLLSGTGLTGNSLIDVSQPKSPQQGLLSSYQTGGNPNASPNLVGQIAPTTGTNTNNYPQGTTVPDVTSPATNGAPQYALASPYSPTDQSPEAVAYRAANPPNNYATAVQNLANISANNPALGVANQNLLNYAQEYQNKQAGIAGSGADLAFKQGEQQVLQNTAQQGLLARQQAVNNALQGQNLKQTGAQQVVSATAPILGQYGQANYNPLAPTDTTGGGALNPLNNISSIAQQVLNGQISPSTAKSMGGNVSNFIGALNAELQRQSGGKYNEATQQAAYDARQQNATVSGTTPTSAAANVYTSTYPQVAQLKTTTQNIGQFGNLLLSTMKDSQGNTINPSDVKYANQTIAGIRSQLSSSQQAQFDTTFAQLRAQIANLLSTGGGQIPSQTTADANKIIDGSAPLNTLSATLARIETEGNILQQNLQGQLNAAGSVIGAPKVGSSNNPLGI